MKLGNKVAHRYFSANEYVCMKIENEYTFEDGVTCSPFDFWKDRQGEDWENDWEIVLVSDGRFQNANP